MLSHSANLILGPEPRLTAISFEPCYPSTWPVCFLCENIPEGSLVLWHYMERVLDWQLKSVASGFKHVTGLGLSN